jgi:SHS family lactate transporter-like MFS transporter
VPRLARHQWLVLGLAGLATLLAAFDSSVLVLALPAISAEFHAGVPALANVGSVLALGSLGALPLGMLADRLGRRRMLAVAVFGFSLANLLSGLAPSLAVLALTRLLAVCFETLAAGVATALVVEELPAAARGMSVAAITVAAGGGTGLTVLLYPLLAPRWRALYLLGGLGVLGGLLLWARLPESETWRASRHEGVPLAVLWKPPWRRRLLLVGVAGALGALLLQPASLLVFLFGSQSLHLDPLAISAVVFVSGVVSVPAFLVGGRLSDAYGRRLLGAGLVALTALAVAATFAGGLAAFWVGNVVWSVIASAAVPILGAWFGELFPTRARATSEAVNALAGALGGIAGLQLVGLLEPRLGFGGSILAVAAGAIAGAALLLALPETRGDPLPD